MSRRLATALIVVLGLSIAMVWLAGGKDLWAGRSEKRVLVVAPSRLIRGAWQSPEALREIIHRERIKTVLTLTAINRDDPKYVEQLNALQQIDVDWLIVPMRGSHGTLEQIAQAADILADSARQPVFFHCVAGHHRTSQVHAAYLIRHCGYSAKSAWELVSGLPWARPAAKADQADRKLIEAFARNQSSLPHVDAEFRREVDHEGTPDIVRPTDRQADRVGRGLDAALRRVGSSEF